MSLALAAASSAQRGIRGDAGHQQCFPDHGLGTEEGHPTPAGLILRGAIDQEPDAIGGQVIISAAIEIGDAGGILGAKLIDLLGLPGGEEAVAAGQLRKAVFAGSRRRYLHGCGHNGYYHALASHGGRAVGETP